MKKVLFIVIIVMEINTFAFCGKRDFSRDNSHNPKNKQITNTADMEVKLKIRDKIFTAIFYHNATAKVFKEMLPIRLNMEDYGGFEKVGILSQSLPTDDKRENDIVNGDIMLYRANHIVIFYANSGGYDYTRIGKINNIENLRESLGLGDVIVEFFEQ